MIDQMGKNNFDTIDNATPDSHDKFTRVAIPLNQQVIYPHIIAPVRLTQDRSIAAANAAADQNQTAICISAEDDVEQQTIDADTIGTEIALGRSLQLPNQQRMILVEGRRRVQILRTVQTEPYIVVECQEVKDSWDDAQQVEVLYNNLLDHLERIVELNERFPEDILQTAIDRDDPGWLADFFASAFNADYEDQLHMLQLQQLEARLRHAIQIAQREVNSLELKDEINGHIQQEIAHNQRELYLREQMRIIQDELGEEDIFLQEFNELREQIDTAQMPESVYTKAQRELKRLQQMPPMAPEVGIIRTYLDWLVALPWHKTSPDNLDLHHAQKVLDEDHFGLKKVKDRILEHIAVRKLAAEEMKSPVLCFVGPPGVGKTSLGKSIAKALGREFVRVSLGGIHDEAEIRGHRRTYIGALPGRIIQTMRRAGTLNPVFMLDEIDKLGFDYRGDPSAALLEALDPEQNNSYSDHYLDVPYDLSQVMFITTANDLSPLSSALLDRLEIIEFPGYTEEEKVQIARQFLIPNQLKAHGLADSHIQYATDSILTIIRDYTYESGVRNLNREIGSVSRKLARRVAEGKKHPKRVTAQIVEKELGPPEHIAQHANTIDSIGTVTGLAWTSNGGDILTIEAALLPGKGNLTLTGQLGDIMQESAQAALGYMRSRAHEFDIPIDDFDNYDIHIHLPEGAVPKDGPSAGITLATAIFSIFTERKVRSDIAMTGEITLRGSVLVVGGIKEKLLAAHRAKIKNVILPAQNSKDLPELPANIRKDMNLILVENMQQVIDSVLLDPPPEGRERDRLNAQNNDSEDDGEN